MTSGNERRILADLGRDPGRFIIGDTVGHGGAHPERAFIQMRHEFGADKGRDSRASASSTPEPRDDAPGMLQAIVEPLGVARLDVLKIALRRSTTPSRMNQAQSTGSSVRVTISEPIRANTIVSAIGLNSSAGRPGQDIDRQEAHHDHGDGIDQRAVHFRGRILDDLA